MSGTHGRKKGKECVVSESPSGEATFAYTREQAIANGELIDVTEITVEAGIRPPTYLTRTVWDRYVVVPDGASGQDRGRRLLEILWMARCAMAKNLDSSAVLFTLHVADERGPEKPVTLKVGCGPGDDHEPVITIMLPDEY